MLAYTFETRRLSENIKVWQSGDWTRIMMPKPKKGIVKRGAWEITKKLLKAIPIIGPVFIVGFAGRDIQKKGVGPGAVHVGLDLTPVVGTAKNILEIFTGDLIPDKAPRNPGVGIQAGGAEPPSQPERLSDPPAISHPAAKQIQNRER